MILTLFHYISCPVGEIPPGRPLIYAAKQYDSVVEPQVGYPMHMKIYGVLSCSHELSEYL